jgi:type II secretory pathway component PulK
MNRRGFALLLTLWLTAALAVVVAGTLTLVRLELGAAENRDALLRGRWAGEGCLALLQGELARGIGLRSLDSVDLGGGTWCRATLEDEGAKLSVEPANAEGLAYLVGSPERAAALLDWIDPDTLPRLGGAERAWYLAAGRRLPTDGPLAAVAELRYVRGFEPAQVANLGALLTATTGGRVNVNAASSEVLIAVLGIPPAAARLLIAHREARGPIRDLDACLSILPSALRAPLVARYAELQGRVTFTPELVRLGLEGHVAGRRVTARSSLLTAPAAGRLAILTREEW